MAVAPPILILPFVLLLVAMAFAPVLAAPWWHRHYPKVALGLGMIVAVAYSFCLRDTASLWHALHEYLSFIALIGSLFVVAGAIEVEVPGGAGSLANVIFLLAGAVAANLLGTTGAAMLLIRPWIQMNQPRVRAHHIVFFIFLVANVGGCLTPIGDPPLFLGYLEGVPFWWIAQKSWLIWATALGALLAIFYALDKWHARRAPAAGPATGRWRVRGRPHLFFLLVILLAVFVTRPPFVREGLMLAAAAASFFTANKAVHAANNFNFHPILEVAILFAGIFVTMIPALAWLDQSAATLLGRNPSPAVFYWGTGSLSAVLDNAPTYLGFLNALRGVAGLRPAADLLAASGAQVLAISVGAVFFGAATYIGNGPNFMVKAIAHERGVAMPSFAGFVLKYACPFLLPVLVLVWFLFFRD